FFTRSNASSIRCNLSLFIQPHLTPFTDFFNLLKEPATSLDEGLLSMWNDTRRPCFISPIAFLLVASSFSVCFSDPSDYLGTDETSRLIGLYRQLHANPELSFEEKQTAESVAAELKSVGAEVTTGVGGHGVVGLLKNGKGDLLMLRADMDALPIV